MRGRDCLISIPYQIRDKFGFRYFCSYGSVEWILSPNLLHTGNTNPYHHSTNPYFPDSPTHHIPNTDGAENSGRYSFSHHNQAALTSYTKTDSCLTDADFRYSVGSSFLLYVVQILDGVVVEWPWRGWITGCLVTPCIRGSMSYARFCGNGTFRASWSIRNSDVFRTVAPETGICNAWCGKKEIP